MGQKGEKSVLLNMVCHIAKVVQQDYRGSFSIGN